MIFKCIDRVVVHTHSEHWKHFRSVFMSADVGPTETNKGTEWFNLIWGEKNCHMKKKKCSLLNDNFVSRASTIIGIMFTLYHQELIKKTNSVYVLYAVCNPRVNASFELISLFPIKTQTLPVSG